MKPRSKKLTATIDSYETWMHKTWRPAMGWLYMATCAFDFIIFPIVWSATQALLKMPVTQWDPLTLKGAGFYHLAMGAILGVTAWSRGQEKLAVLNSELWHDTENKSTKTNTSKKSSDTSTPTLMPGNPEEDEDTPVK